MTVVDGPGRGYGGVRSDIVLTSRGHTSCSGVSPVRKMLRIMHEVGNRGNSSAGGQITHVVGNDGHRGSEKTLASYLYAISHIVVWYSNSYTYRNSGIVFACSP